MDGVCDDDLCWLQLDDFRMLLIKTIDPSRITPYLRQCQVITAEDEEQLFNDPTLVLRRRKVGFLLDTLQKTGVKGYTAFLESLELDYPNLYSRITGKEPNKTFSILIDTVGESGLTAFLMSELSHLQRALQEERRLRQQACSAAEDQKAWSFQQKLKDRELIKLTERLQKLRSEREYLTEEVKHLRDHNYSLMADINALNQEKSNALLANRDLQIEVERLKNTVLKAENETRLWKRKTMRTMPEAKSPSIPDEPVLQPKEELKEEKPKETQTLKPESFAPMNLVTTVFRLRRELHKAEEQKTKSLEEKEELELLCTQLEGDAKMYCQQGKQTLRQLEEVIQERDKALALQVQKQEEVRLLLHEKDQYRARVRELTEKSDKLELVLLRSKGEQLQLRTRLRKLNLNSHQSEKSASSEEVEEPRERTSEGKASCGSCCSEPSEVYGTAQQTAVSSAVEGSKEKLPGRGKFCYRRKRALRSKLNCTEFVAEKLDDSTGSDTTESD
ncbi:caspase recruitment domain-containing protein 9 isoform X2 [Oryzias melastigma]|uniref:caspase recruitment domain-containing protein 9 isoform X2 n=1 Tax=Oryzias melastigma TaxID=30732 RepID=UPI000CF82482|nr:caspase recruitment domain-containing protein 9 isoform X2 [Oryzias melastigma]